MIGRLVSIQVGRPREYPAEPNSSARPAWVSGIVKEPVSGPVYVAATNLAGDEQADLENHGGPDKAVLGYAASHYPAWREEYPDIDFQFGGFGENLTIEGISELLCCVGDIVAIGGCRLQVSQPRQPCWKLSRRWKMPQLAAIVQKNGRTGWYFRVLREGEIESGMGIELVERPFPNFTIQWASSVMHSKHSSGTDEMALANCPALSQSWRVELRSRAEKHERKSPSQRLLGSSGED